jgi:hypothetical protein
MLYIHGEWRQNITKTCIVLSIHIEWIVHKQNTMNEKVRQFERNIFIGIWKQWFEVCSTWLLRKQVFWLVAPCGWVICYRGFEETCPLHPRCYQSTDSFTTLKMEELLLSKLREAANQSHCANPRRPAYSILKQGCNKIFQRCVICSWLGGKLAATQAVMFRCSTLSLRVAYYRSDRKVSCYYRRFTYI